MIERVDSVLFPLEDDLQKESSENMANATPCDLEFHIYMETNLLDHLSDMNSVFRKNIEFNNLLNVKRILEGEKSHKEIADELDAFQDVVTRAKNRYEEKGAIEQRGISRDYRPIFKGYNWYISETLQQKIERGEIEADTNLSEVEREAYQDISNTINAFTKKRDEGDPSSKLRGFLKFMDNPSISWKELAEFLDMKNVRGYVNEWKDSGLIRKTGFRNFEPTDKGHMTEIMIGKQFQGLLWEEIKTMSRDLALNSIIYDDKGMDQSIEMLLGRLKNLSPLEYSERKEVVESMINFYNEKGRPPLKKEFLSDERYPSPNFSGSSIYDELGGWEKILESVLPEYNSKKMGSISRENYSPDSMKELYQDIVEVNRKIDGELTYEDYLKHGEYTAPLEKMKWQKLKENAGIANQAA